VETLLKGGASAAEGVAEAKTAHGAAAVAAVVEDRVACSTLTVEFPAREEVIWSGCAGWKRSA
jgi:hypothetical protein